MAMKVGELVQILRVDNKPHKRGLQEAKADSEKEGDKAGKGWAGNFRKAIMTGLRRGLIWAVLAPFATAMLAGAATVAAQFAAHFIAQAVSILGPGLAAIGLLIPAAIGAGVLAMGALKIALHGFGDAVSAGLSGNVAKFNKDLAKMGPAAQQAAKAIVSLKPQLDQLRNAVQAAFFEKFAAQIKPLALIYLPILRSNLAFVASVLGAAASQIGHLFDNPDAARQVTGLLSDMGAAIRNIAAGVPAIVQGLFDLMAVGASFLPGLTSGFAGLADRFSAWMAELAGSGRLHDFIAGGLAGLADLVKIFGTLAGIVHTVLGAAIQGGLLDGLNVLGDAVKTLVREAGPGLKDLMMGLVAGLLALAPAARPVGRALAEVMTALAPLLPVIGTLGRVLLTALADVLILVSAELGPVISLFSQWAEGSLPMLLPLLATLVQGALPLVVQMMTNLYTAVEPLIPQLLALSKTAIAQLLPLLPQWFTALQDLIPPVTQLAVALVPLLIDVIRILIPFIPILVDWLTNLIRVFGGVVGVLAFVIAVFAKVVGAVRDAAYVFGWFLAEVNRLPGQIVGIFSSAGQWLFDAGRRILDGLIQGVRNRIVELKNVLSSITNLIPDWKGPLDTDRKLLMPAGSAIMGGLMAGIRGRLGDLRGTLGQVTATIDGTGGSAATSAGRPTVGGTAAGGDPRLLAATQETNRLLRNLRLIADATGLALTVRKGEKDLRYTG